MKSKQQGLTMLFYAAFALTLQGCASKPSQQADAPDPIDNDAIQYYTFSNIPAREPAQAIRDIYDVTTIVHDHTNLMVLKGSNENFARVLELAKRLDAPSESLIAPHPLYICTIKQRKAGEVAELLNQMVASGFFKNNVLQSPARIAIVVEEQQNALIIDMDHMHQARMRKILDVLDQKAAAQQ